MYLFAIIVIFLFAIFGIIIGAQNFSSFVCINILGKKITDISLTIALIQAFGAGAVFAFILAIIDEVKLRGRISKQKKEIATLHKEVGTLRTGSLDTLPEEKEVTTSGE